jgi:hypothetical protein
MTEWQRAPVVASYSVTPMTASIGLPNRLASRRAALIAVSLVGTTGGRVVEIAPQNCDNTFIKSLIG